MDLHGIDGNLLRQVKKENSRSDSRKSAWQAHSFSKFDCLCVMYSRTVSVLQPAVLSTCSYFVTVSFTFCTI